MGRKFHSGSCLRHEALYWLESRGLPMFLHRNIWIIPLPKSLVEVEPATAHEIANDDMFVRQGNVVRLRT